MRPGFPLFDYPRGRLKPRGRSLPPGLGLSLSCGSQKWNPTPTSLGMCQLHLGEELLQCRRGGTGQGRSLARRLARRPALGLTFDRGESS